jgi:flagellar assembly factor FliW
MKIATKHFGEVDIKEDKILIFEKGLFGFEDYKKYIILYEGNEEQMNVFCWLQSIEEESVALPLVNPMLFFKDYSPEVVDKEVEELGEIEDKSLEVYSVIVIPEEIEKMTINLKAPIIINNKTKKCAQLIAQGDTYKVKHNLYEKLQGMETLKKVEGV